MSGVDGVTLSVFENALMSVAEESGRVLIRTAYSTNIKEREDCSAALFAADGRVAAQADHVPIHLGSMMGLVGEILKRVPREDMQPGDMWIANDPFTGGGTHLPDIAVCAPAFVDGEIVAFAANIGHHSDVGGLVPGSNAANATTIYQEGLRLPPVRIVRRGELVRDVLEIVMLNSRAPEERSGDVQAQVAACKFACRRIASVCAHYGRVRFQELLEQVMNYAERRLRSGIRAIPNGTYRFEDFLDDDGMGSAPIPIRVVVSVQDDRLDFDFTGTGDQARGGVNLVPLALVATVAYAVKSIIDPGVPANSGYHRALTVRAPEGSLVNPRRRAPVAARTDTAQRVADVVFGALAQALPDRAMAGCHSSVTAPVIAGTRRDGAPYVFPETVGGGLGARSSADGMDGVQAHITNTSNLPVECLEAEYPLLVERYAFLPDSGGPGHFRGGLGLRRDVRVLEGEATFTSHGDRQKIPAWGLSDGLPGRTGRFVINPGSSTERVLPGGKNADIPLSAGDVLSTQTPGGGGYGPPGERSRQLLAHDLATGAVSAAAAAASYGQDGRPDDDAGPEGDASRPESMDG